jgi:hypothetical protein
MQSNGSETATPQPAPEPLSSGAHPRRCGDINADDRQKLDYERQCYRHTEIIARDRLQLLQNAVDKTVDAVKRKGDP